MSTHNFDQAVALSGDADNRTNTIHPAYQNMVGPYGGITSAALLNSVLQHPQAEGTPVALTVNFLGPINGESMTIRPRLVRKNRSNQHWSLEAFDNEEPVLTATLVMASRRDTWEDTELSFPDCPNFDEIDPVPPELLITWAQQYDFRFAVGGLLGSGEKGDAPSETLNWVKDKPDRPLDFLSLCALCDTFFPRLLVRHSEFAPIGTVSFTVHFHVGQEELNSLNDGWVLGNARASKFHGSYFDQTAEVWSSNKTLLATTSQIVYYKY